MTRSTMMGILDGNFIRHGRLSGLPERTLLRYALRNALPPVVTLVAIIWLPARRRHADRACSAGAGSASTVQAMSTPLRQSGLCPGDRDVHAVPVFSCRSSLLRHRPRISIDAHSSDGSMTETLRYQPLRPPATDSQFGFAIIAVMLALVFVAPLLTGYDPLGGQPG